MNDATRSLLTRLAKGIAQQFGEHCEVVVHDMTHHDPEHTIVAIENGQVTKRALGDGPSHVVLKAMRGDAEKLIDEAGYLTRTDDGRILKSTTVYIRDEQGNVEGIFAINYDITGLLMLENAVKPLTQPLDQQKPPERIARSVNDLLDELIDQSVQLVGKPVAMMNKEDKVKAIQFLNESGALLITKSGDKISKHFGISKYTLYNYIDVK
ncbi:MAG: helix-turn-helix transcriptional regulator [Clostridia bacterium]